MPATVTVTGTAGAGVAVSALVFTNVSEFNINANTNMLYMIKDGVNIPGISVNAATTVTATKTGNTWTLTIS